MIALDFTPTEEDQISAIARQTGLAPAEYVKKLVKEHMPPVQPTPPPLSAKNKAAIALLNRWIAENATDDPEEIHRADAEAQELMESLNRNRVESGGRPLLP